MSVRSPRRMFVSTTMKADDEGVTDTLASMARAYQSRHSGGG